MLELHPLLNPAAYISARFGDREGRVERSPAHDDGAWIAWCGPTKVAPLQAIVRAVDPTLNMQVEGTDDDWDFVIHVGSSGT